MVVWCHRTLWESGSGKGQNVPWYRLMDGSLPMEASDAGKLAICSLNACHWEGLEYARACWHQMLAENVFEELIGVDVFCKRKEYIRSIMHPTNTTFPF
jgi:hypothetical protein